MVGGWKEEREAEKGAIRRRKKEIVWKGGYMGKRGTPKKSL